MTVTELLEPVRERAEAVRSFQLTLNGLPTPMAQKIAITEAYSRGRITADDAELLVQVYQLETA